MTILLTGATGLVGERLLTRLVQAGVSCRALVRAGKTVSVGANVCEATFSTATRLKGRSMASRQSCILPPCFAPPIRI